LPGRPEAIFHGTSVLVSVLEPRKGAVYAAHDRSIAIAFALVIRPDARGRSQWQLHMGGDEPRITIVHGWLDTTGIGYVYRLSPDGFEQRQFEWLSQKPMTPLGYEIIRSADYAHWVTSGEIR
jgi:hypothetical protein